jgi:hypothetical protein
VLFLIPDPKSRFNLTEATSLPNGITRKIDPRLDVDASASNISAPANADALRHVGRGEIAVRSPSIVREAYLSSACATSKQLNY